MVTAITVSIAVLFLAALFVSSRRQRKYPPGPKGLPLIGIALEHPKSEFWKTYVEWGNKYGKDGLISFHVLGRRIVVVNSATAGEDLLVRRSAIYSDKPFPPMAKLMKREKSIFYLSYNDRFRAYRRLLRHDFNPTASQNYWNIAEEQARLLIVNIDKEPSTLFECLRQNAAAVTMKVAYGYTVNGNNDYFVSLAEEGMRIASLALAPGKWIVDSIPVLQYAPSWLPGIGFKQKAKLWGEQLYNQSLKPHDWVKAQIAKGVWEPSYTSRLLESRDAHVSVSDHEDLVLWTSGGLYTAGADTTVSSMKTFVFLMMLHPEIQARAQAEVDSIIAKEQRLPRIQDREFMPYLEAVMKEVLRWSPPAPLLFHCSAKDDEYNGHFIPGKTLVMFNLWAMLHDPEQYPEPFKFNPDRFYQGNSSKTEMQRNPLDIVFSLGRRICPGQHIAEASVFIQMATFLAFLNISKGVDEHGHSIEPSIEFTTGVVSHVKSFAYSLSRRSERSLDILLQDIDA